MTNAGRDPLDMDDDEEEWEDDDEIQDDDEKQDKRYVEEDDVQQALRPEDEPPPEEEKPRGEACGYCHGSGLAGNTDPSRDPEDPCRNCGGSGWVGR